MIDRALREEIEAAVFAEVERVGPGGLAKAAIVGRFLGRGASRASIYRAIDRPLHSGRAGQRLAIKVKQAAARRAKATEPAGDVASDAAEMLPTLLGLEDTTGLSTVEIIASLNECMSVAKRVMAHGVTPDGHVRNSKLVLTGSEHLRRCVETRCRLQKALHDVQQIEKFNAAIVETIRAVAEECPEAAELILRRTRALAITWATEMQPRRVNGSARR